MKRDMIPKRKLLALSLSLSVWCGVLISTTKKRVCNAIRFNGLNWTHLYFGSFHRNDTNTHILTSLCVCLCTMHESTYLTIDIMYSSPHTRHLFKFHYYKNDSQFENHIRKMKRLSKWKWRKKSKTKILKLNWNINNAHDFPVIVSSVKIQRKRQQQRIKNDISL